MKERDIFIIICILLILSVIKIINNKFIENFETKFKFTKTTAKNTFDAAISNKGEGQGLNITSADIEAKVNAENELEESQKLQDILTRRQREEEELFNSSHGKFQKFEKKSCAFLDITTMPCSDDPSNNNSITNCKINCAQNCLLDENCISFQYDNNTNTCKLSSSCYEGNLNDNRNSDIYFKKVCDNPSIQFTEEPNKKCGSSYETKADIKDINECARHCNLNNSCTSFSYNNNKKKCEFTKKCSIDNREEIVEDDDFKLYFKKGESCNIPSLAQFRKVPKKVCPNHTKINNKRFPNTTLSECAQKCLDNNPQCISFEYKKKDGNDNNVCHLTNDCHRYYYTNDNNSDVFMKNNVKVNENVNYPPPTCSQTNETDYYNRWIHFFWKKKQNHRKWSYPINSKPGERKDVKYVGRWPNDEWLSAKIPPRTIVDLCHHGNYKGCITIKNESYNDYKDIDNLHDYRIGDSISSFKAVSI